MRHSELYLKPRKVEALQPGQNAARDGGGGEADEKDRHPVAPPFHQYLVHEDLTEEW